MDWVADRVAQALARLPECNRTPFIEALITSWVEQAQEIENAAAQIRAGMHPAGAVGVRLDGLGRILKWPRRGMADNAYRPMLQVAARVNKNSCWVDDLIGIIAIVEPALEVSYLLSPPAEYVFRLEGVATTPIEVIQMVVQRMRPAGTRVHFERLDTSAATTWTLKRHASADTSAKSPGSWFDDPNTGAHGRRAWSNAPW